MVANNNIIYTIVAQCTAQLYSYLTFLGSKIEDITCVGEWNKTVAGEMLKYLIQDIV